MTTPIPTGDLEKYLWGAAVLLRGQIDASGYKEFIFPLLFFGTAPKLVETRF